MRNRIALTVVLALFASVPVRADMIEIRDRGVLNGKIVSQDEKEVHFEDSAKNMIVVPKSDVLFLEVQNASAVTASAATGAAKPAVSWSRRFEHWKSKAERFYHDAKSFVIGKTKRAKDFMNKPLDRSAADSRSKALADSMGDLSNNLKKMNKQDRKRVQQLGGLRADTSHRKASRTGVAAPSNRRKSLDEGRFGSL